MRLAETRQAGLSKEPLVSVEESEEQGGTGNTNGDVQDGFKAEKAEGVGTLVSVASVTDLATEGKDTVQSGREEPRTGEIRLRRKPLGSTAV